MFKKQKEETTMTQADKIKKTTSLRITPKKKSNKSLK
jgi:hypothetical protein